MRKAGLLAVVAFVIVDAGLVTMAIHHTRPAESTTRVVTRVSTSVSPITPAVLVDAPPSSADGTPSVRAGRLPVTPSPTTTASTTTSTPTTTPSATTSAPNSPTSAPNSPTSAPPSPVMTSSPVSTSAPTTSATTSPSTSTHTTATRSATTAASRPASQQILLDMASDGVVIRAERGSCPATSPATLEISNDGGASWATVATKSTAILRVGAQRGGHLWYVGADSRCTATEYDTDDGGDTWTTGGGASAWALLPDATATSIDAPHGESAVGCVPVALSGIGSDSAVVACSNGAVRVTKDAGKSWSTASTVPGIVGISFTGADTGVALAAQGACGAVVGRTTDGGRHWTRLTCLNGDQPAAIAAAGDSIRAQVGSVMYGSNDGGKSFAPVSPEPQ